MRFKRIALFFILIANTTLLAHSLIPHHHHNGLAVSVATTISSHHSDKSFNDHSHDKDDDSDCILRKEILIPGRSFRSLLNQSDSDPKLNLFHDFNISIPILNPPGYFLTCLSYGVHYDRSHYLFCLNSSQGLRAPPIS